MKRLLLFANLILVLLGIEAAQAQREEISLEETEKRAIKSSYYSMALEAESQAFKNKIKAQQSLLFPKITLEGNYRYVSKIPSLSFPGGAKTAFGDHHNYSIGPSLTWTLWDFGSARKSIQSTKAQSKSKQEEKKMSLRQTLLSARLAYFKIQLRLEQQRLLSESLKLAQSQYKDIKNRAQAGSASRIDLLSSHKEVLKFQIQTRQIKTELKTDLRDLYALIGKDETADISDSIQVDSINSTLKTLSNKYEHINLDAKSLDEHPLIKMQTANIEANRLIAESFSATQLPKLALLARSSMDYPNGPILNEIHQNTIGLMISMPLYEGHKSFNESAEKKNLVKAFENRRQQARREIMRDWNKARDELNGLKEKTEFYNTARIESLEHANLVYSSYRAGKSSFLEVQSANLHALETSVQSTTNQVQILIQLAFLASISKELL